jgi:hypothetical protein
MKVKTVVAIGMTFTSQRLFVIVILEFTTQSEGFGLFIYHHPSRHRPFTACSGSEF